MLGKSGTFVHSSVSPLHKLNCEQWLFVLSSVCGAAEFLLAIFLALRLLRKVVLTTEMATHFDLYHIAITLPLDTGQSETNFRTSPPEIFATPESLDLSPVCRGYRGRITIRVAQLDCRLWNIAIRTHSRSLKLVSWSPLLRTQ